MTTEFFHVCTTNMPILFLTNVYIMTMFGTGARAEADSTVQHRRFPEGDAWPLDP